MSTLQQMHKSLTMQNQSQVQILTTLQRKPPTLTHTYRHRQLHRKQATQCIGYRKPLYSVKSRVLARFNMCIKFVGDKAVMHT